jgi:tRNA pseudouridine38-40 synthase
MAHYQIILAYDGTDFQGFQRLGKGRSVQEEVEKALRQLNWQGRAILGAGRTDTGVHASGQVAAFDLDWPHTTEELQHALNAHLPADVAVMAAQEAAADFHPRYDARARTYRYRIYHLPQRDPLQERFAWRVWPPLHLSILQEAARLLPGEHDFAAFGAPHKKGGCTVRSVFRAVWEQQAGGLLFEISANAFLYHMVRRLVYTQVLAGAGRLALEDLAQGVLAAQPQPPGLAPAQGLVLNEVLYSLPHRRDI